MTQPTMIITGASRGLGEFIALAAAEQGFQVVLSARNRDGLQAVAQKIEQRGGKVLTVEGDVSRYADCKNIVEQAAQVFGRIDVLVNNAAVIEPMARVVEDCHEAWANLLAINLLGPAMLCQVAIPYLRESAGKVINISSGAATNAVPGSSAYCASKAGLNHFSVVLAVEEPQITVLCLDPGSMHTDMQAVIREKGKGKAPDELYRYFVGLYEQGQLIPPEKPAQAVVALALRAPREWTGAFMPWDDERVQGILGSEVHP